MPKLIVRRPYKRRSLPAMTGLGKSKPDSRSTLDWLDDEQLQQLCKWMTSGVSYTEQIKRMQDLFGIKTNAFALGNFYRKYVDEFLEERRKRALEKVYKVNDYIKRKPAVFYGATVDEFERRTFDLLNGRDVDPKELKIHMELLLRLRQVKNEERKIKMREREIRLLEKQNQEAREAVNDSKLTPAEKAERIGQILKLVPTDAKTPTYQTEQSQTKNVPNAHNGHTNGNGIAS